MLGNRVIVLFAIFSTSALAQWLSYSVPGTPRTRDGKPNLTAPAPRALNGKPDLSGVWHVQPTGMKEMKRLFGEHADATDVPGMELDTISKYAVNILQDFKPEEWPIRPEALEIQRRRTGADFPSTHCLPLGIPLSGLLSEPTKIVQSPRLIAILYEADDKHRQIYTDGRALPKEFDQPAWLGYSVGHWDRDTLVVESAGFNDKTWLDIMGHPHSDALRVMERYHRRDFGHMDVETTFDDPKMYTKPFTIRVTDELWADSDIFEFFCNENEKDRTHMGDK
jgi:hypothetical protein